MFLEPNKTSKSRSKVALAVCSILVLASVLFGCAGKPPKFKGLRVPKGWIYSKHNSFVKIIEAEEDKYEERGYKMRIVRKTDSTTDAEYIRLAEAVYPGRKKVLKTVKNKTREKSWYFERIWWGETYKGRRIPYALTADTVNQYIEYYKKYKSDLIKYRNENPNVYGDNRYRVEFDYLAVVTRPEGKGKHSGKVTVSLFMRWFEYCGLPCGWGFEASRTVVFSSPRRVTEIEGDGDITRWESTDKDPYGREWFSF